MDTEDIAAKGCACLIVFLLYIALGAGMAWCIEWAWNTLIPVVFHGPSINYTEGIAIYVLASFFLGFLRSSSSTGKG